MFPCLTFPLDVIIDCETKEIRMRKTICALCILSFIFTGALPAAERSKESIRKKLKIIIPRVRLQDVTVEQAIAYLKRASSEQDPEVKGINIIYVKSDKKVLKK